MSRILARNDLMCNEALTDKQTYHKQNEFSCVSFHIQLYFHGLLTIYGCEYTTEKSLKCFNLFKTKIICTRPIKTILSLIHYLPDSQFLNFEYSTFPSKKKV